MFDLAAVTQPSVYDEPNATARSFPVEVHSSKKETVNGPSVVPEVRVDGTTKPPMLRLPPSWFTIAWPVGGAVVALPTSEIVNG